MEYIKSSDRDLLEEDVEFIRARSNLVERALNGRLIIPDFVKFTSIIDDIYHETLPNVSGNNADYIPQLAKGIFFRFFFCFFRSLSLFRSRSLSCSRSLSLSHLLCLSSLSIQSILISLVLLSVPLMANATALVMLAFHFACNHVRK